MLNVEISCIIFPIFHDPLQLFEKVWDLLEEQPDFLKNFSHFLLEAHSLATHMQQEHKEQLAHSANGPENGKLNVSTI